MTSAAPPRRSATPWVVLACSLLLTAAATWAAAATARARVEARFANAVQATRDRIDARLDTYVALLQATAAMFSASDSVSRNDFTAYADRLRVRQRYPGIQGIGFTRRMMPDEVPAVERRLRLEGEAAFHVWPDTARPEYHAILYLQPLDRRNQAAIGYDMFTEPVRREAMIRARDVGGPAASGRVQLVQEIDQRKQAGFLIYVPLYRRGRMPADVEARRTALEGFVYAPFRADDLFEGIFGSEREPRVDVRIYDGSHVDPAALLHDSRRERPAGIAPRSGSADARSAAPASSTSPPSRSDTVTIETAGRTWTLVFTPTRALLAGAGVALAPLVLVAGVLVSALLFVLARAQARDRERTRRTAREMEALARELQARNAELAAANRAKSDFLATMSHEIRTPINAIVGYTQLLGMGLSGPVTPEQNAQLERIGASGKHLLGLIDDILDLSRIEAGRLGVGSATAVAGETVDAALAIVRPQAEAKGIALGARCEGLRDAPYIGDEQRVRQILVNLLANAVKFTGAGGRVGVTCGRAERLPGGVEAAELGPWTCITVEDTGIGITPAMQQRIFQPFVQAESGYTRAHSGTGLGLSISRRLARLMGGELTVESVPGEGSRFTLWLPAGAAAEAPSMEVSSA